MQMTHLFPIITEIADCNHHGHYFPALMSTLSLPDICAALNAEDGQTSRARYIAWMNQWTTWHETYVDLIYGFRCSMLHQGSGHAHRSGGTRVAFVHPAEPGGLHGIIRQVDDDDPGVLVFKLDRFIEQMLMHVQGWWHHNHEDEIVHRNLEKFILVRDGLMPWLPPGWAVIG